MKTTAMIALVTTLLAAACGSIEGNNPVGVTGGSVYNPLDAELFGRWVYYSPYMINDYLTLRPDGTCNYRVEFGLPTNAEGKWRADGTVYRIDVDEFYPKTGTYSVDSNNLYLRSGDGVFHYVRISE